LPKKSKKKRDGWIKDRTEGWEKRLLKLKEAERKRREADVEKEALRKAEEKNS